MLKYLLLQSHVQKDLPLEFFKIVLFYQTTKILIKSNRMKMIFLKKKIQIKNRQIQELKELQKKYWITTYNQKTNNYFKMRILDSKTYPPDVLNLQEI